nr:DUF3168 domain-containing protein [Afifella sp. IM 167]
MQKAVYERLAADSGLAALIGPGRVFDYVPRGAEAPYLHLGEMAAKAGEDGGPDVGGALTEIAFALVAFSRGRGRKEALAIAAAARASLHDADFALDGFSLVNCRFVSLTTTGAGEASGRRAVVRFRAVVEG